MSVVDQPTILTLARLERELPIINWRKPLVLATADGASTGYACRVCIAVLGLHSSEVQSLPKTWPEFAEHFRMAHDAEPEL